MVRRSACSARSRQASLTNAVSKDVGVFGGRQLGIGGQLPRTQRELRVPLLFEPDFIEPGHRKRFDAAHLHEVQQGTARRAAAVDPEHVGV